MVEQPQHQPTRLDDIVARAQRPPPQEVLERSLVGAIQTRDHIIELFSDLVAYCQQCERDLAGTREALERERAAAQAEIALLVDERATLQDELARGKQEIEGLQRRAEQRAQADLDGVNGAHHDDQAQALIAAQPDRPR